MFYEWHPNDASVKKIFKKIITVPNSYVCYSKYPTNYKFNKDGNMYFGFPANKNISKLISAINRNFKNIKIRIVEVKQLKFTDEYSLFGDVNGLKEYSYYVFKIDLDSAFTENSKFILRLTLAEFIRVYCPYYNHYKKMFEVKKNYINSALKAQETGLYGGWICCDPSGDYKVSRDTFNKFDNIDLINDITINIGDTRYLPSISTFIRALDGSIQKAVFCKGVAW